MPQYVAVADPKPKLGLNQPDQNQLSADGKLNGKDPKPKKATVTPWQIHFCLTKKDSNGNLRWKGMKHAEDLPPECQFNGAAAQNKANDWSDTREEYNKFIKALANSKTNKGLEETLALELIDSKAP